MDGVSGKGIIEMVEFTERARDMVLRFAQATDDPKVRIAMHGSPFSPEYEFALVEETPTDGDSVVDFDGFTVVIDESSAARMQGAVVDWVEGDQGAGFRVTNPNARTLGENAPVGELADKVRHILDTRINPAVASHGGNISLVDVEGTDVFLELGGGCQGCGMARVTLKQGVERMLREAAPEVGRIIDVTDHTAGANPYYSA
jgi:Fe/S biogenesis protein NfuA